ncbi:YmfQ family protein [Pseudoxanthomonas sp. 22568]|uniref:YmfQ family protein n=1 Tax=Pseudoxanthomonas sp. 22568 TaxID=3453945 RepID=UPI003F82AD3A
MTGRDYLRQLQALLPLGKAWTRAPGALLSRVLEGLAQEFARIEARAESVMDEADPRTTLELLPDWERTAGLPDNCSGELRPTLLGRRQDLVSKLNAVGGQTPAYFIEIAKALGYAIEIQEYHPFRVGHSAVNEPINDGRWAHVWAVIAPNVTQTFWTVGQSSVAEPLSRWGNQSLECRLNELKPAHSVLIFIYTGRESYLLLNDGTPILLNDGGYILLNS